MLPLCADQGVGSIPWSPLARGLLTRPWNESTARSETDEFGKTLYADGDRTIVERVQEIAAKRGISPAQVALAWVSRNPVVSAPIVGVTKPRHLQDALDSLDVDLEQSEVEYLEEAYTPHRISGFA